MKFVIAIFMLEQDLDVGNYQQGYIASYKEQEVQIQIKILKQTILSFKMHLSPTASLCFLISIHTYKCSYSYRWL